MSVLQWFWPRSSGAVNHAGGRDLRFDFIRGICLIFIFVDHISGNPLHALTLQRFSFIDAAEVFVFISGFVCGLVYTKAYLRAGLSGCLGKAGRRAVQIYVAQVLVFVASCTVLYLFAGAGAQVLPQDTHLYAFVDRPVATLVAAAALIHAPGLTGLLSLYIVLILLTPLAIPALLKWPGRTLLCSVALYALTQVQPALTLYVLFPSQGAWVFNPFAWQLMFVGALYLGSRRAQRLRVLPELPRWLLVAAMAGLAAIALVRCADSPRLARLLGDDLLLNAVAAIPDGLTDKETMQPLRLLNLLLWIVVASRLHRGLAIWRSAIARPLVVLGSNSLIVYSVGVVLSYAAMGFAELRSAGTMLHLWLVAAGVATMLLAAHLNRLAKGVPSDRSARNAVTPPGSAAERV